LKTLGKENTKENKEREREREIWVKKQTEEDAVLENFLLGSKF
jgi:hypothetical protein